ncbi:unnamed protein product, partial [Rotaria sp. Silwood1]
HDGYHSGDPADWQWISNVKNWQKSDQDRWNNGEYYNHFDLRDGATCDRSLRYAFGRALRRTFGLDFYYYGGLGYAGHVCLCQDNVRN